jgi:hypothetical protein
MESSRASPPHRPREEGLAHPADTSRPNLAAALGLLSGRRLSSPTPETTHTHGERMRQHAYTERGRDNTHREIQHAHTEREREGEGPRHVVTEADDAGRRGAASVQRGRRAVDAGRAAHGHRLAGGAGWAGTRRAPVGHTLRHRAGAHRGQQRRRRQRAPRGAAGHRHAAAGTRPLRCAAVAGCMPSAV